MLKAPAVLTATLQEKEYKKEFPKLFPVQLSDLFAKDFSGKDIKLTKEQEAALAAIDAAFPSPAHKDGEKIKPKVVKEVIADKETGNEIQQFEIADVVEFHVNEALQAAFHAINAKFDIEQRSIARAELEKELGIAKPKKTIKVNDALQNLIDVYVEVKGLSIADATVQAKAKMGIA